MCIGHLLDVCCSVVIATALFDAQEMEGDRAAAGGADRRTQVRGRIDIGEPSDAKDFSVAKLRVVRSRRCSCGCFVVVVAITVAIAVAVIRAITSVDLVDDHAKDRTSDVVDLFR